MRFSALSTLALTTMACATLPAGGQTGEEHDPCVEVESTPLLPDERSSLGFTPNEAVSTAVGIHGQVLSWADGPSSMLTLTITQMGDARFVRLRPRDEEEIRLDRGCADQIDVPVSITLQTEDGTFDDTWALVLHSHQAGVSIDTVRFAVLARHRRLVEQGAAPGSELEAEFSFAQGSRRGTIRTIETIVSKDAATNGKILASF
jgi:hypothetical protein